MFERVHIEEDEKELLYEWERVSIGIYQARIAWLMGKRGQIDAMEVYLKIEQAMGCLDQELLQWKTIRERILKRFPEFASMPTKKEN